MWRHMQMMVVLVVVGTTGAAEEHGGRGFLPGERVLLEAHNAYPYHGLWHNRLDRALAAGFPLAVELDLMWYADAETGGGRVIVAHNPPLSGDEPTLRAYFFDRVRPYMERALSEDYQHDWPLITLNINDIRGNEPQLFEAIIALTHEFEDWLCSAEKGAPPDSKAPITVKPLLILTGGGTLQERFFYEQVPPGGTLRLFGSGNPAEDATNFRRWINYPWSAVERGGQRGAGDWTEDSEERLNGLVRNAHERGYWIRFFSLNGYSAFAAARRGVSPAYSFPSIEAAQLRWTAACKAGVDFVATDMYEELAAWFDACEAVPSRRPVADK